MKKKAQKKLHQLFSFLSQPKATLQLCLLLLVAVLLFGGHLFKAIRLNRDYYHLKKETQKLEKKLAEVRTKKEILKKQSVQKTKALSYQKKNTKNKKIIFNFPDRR